MGTWNETDGLTQLPIEGGDLVRMFLIVENKYSCIENGLTYYSTDLWKPFGLPLKGTYDEYGQIENIQEDILSNLLLESLKEIVIEVPNRMGDEFKKDTLDWETGIRFLTDEGLKVSNPFEIDRVNKQLDAAYDLILKEYENVPKDQWSPRLFEIADKKKNAVKENPAIVNMSHMMVHEDVYQAIVKATVSSEWWGGNGNLREILYEDAAKYIVHLREALPLEEEVERMIKSGNVNGYTKSNVALRSCRRNFRYGNKFFSSFNHLSGDYGSGQYIEKYSKFIESRIKAGARDNDSEIKDLTDQLIDFIQFNRAMSFLRKQWIPQCGKGGQDAEYGLHKFLGQVIVDFSTKKINKWNEEYGEDIDDEGNK